MRRIKLLLLALLLALPIVCGVALAHAQEFRSGSNVNLPAGRTVNSTLFASGRTVNINGTVNGDVFCAGQDVTVNAQVHGDVLCTGQNVTINGNVTGSVRVAAQDLKLGAGVGGSATVAAQTFSQQPEGSVRGDLTIFAQNAAIHGFAGRDVWAAVRSLSISGAIGRNVQAQLQHLQLDPSANVRGDIIYTSPTNLQRSNGAKVGGTITKHTPSTPSGQTKKKTAWTLLLLLYLAALLAAIVLVLLIPQAFERATRKARASMGKTFLVGLLASIIVPAVLLALLFTVVGIPLALLLGLAWLLIVLLAGPFAAYLLGRILLRGPSNAILVMIVGAIILFFLYLLPFIGFFVWLVATWFGLGAILLYLKDGGRPRYSLSPVSGKSSQGQTAEAE